RKTDPMPPTPSESFAPYSRASVMPWSCSSATRSFAVSPTPSRPPTLTASSGRSWPTRGAGRPGAGRSTAWHSGRRPRPSPPPAPSRLHHLLPVAELDRRRRAGLGTRGGLPVGEPVVAQRAFLGDAPALLGTALAGGGGAIGAAIDHAEGAGRHAHPAAVAD